MEILPSEYQQLELTRNEKLFLRYASNEREFGYLLLHTNPAMIKNEVINITITNKGVILFKLFDNFENEQILSMFLPAYKSGVFKDTMEIVKDKLKSNKALIDGKQNIMFSVNFVCIFPSLSREKAKKQNLNSDNMYFINNNCMFSEEFELLRSNFMEITNSFLEHAYIIAGDRNFVISMDNICSILQRITPEYTTVRIGTIIDEKTKAGVDNELLVVDKNDIAVKAYMLDYDQINIINKLNKGEQLILACAGSGKSVLLIAKCFKAARMNPDKKFLITCYNSNLQELYMWFIDRAGLKERNVDCLTFHSLCRRLLIRNHNAVPSNLEERPNALWKKLHLGLIEDRYYGIFIDEVQIFEQEWYKTCYDLLENKDSDEHLFVICGDKTQKIKRQQKNGKAPWNAGEGYPNYRGGNKNIRIEKNYRNCIQVNDYINRFVNCAKEYLYSIQNDIEIDPDMYLRGKAFREGIGVKLIKLQQNSSGAEAETVIKSIKEMHDIHNIPYDEIAIVIFNKTFNKRMKNWEGSYDLGGALSMQLRQNHIAYYAKYASESDHLAMNSDDDGITVVSFDGVLGLDFRAVIVCGLKPFGHYDETKKPKWDELNEIEREVAIENVKKNISYLYVACTRAKDALHIIQPEDRNDSIYINMIDKAI